MEITCTTQEEEEVIIFIDFLLCFLDSDRRATERPVEGGAVEAQAVAHLQTSLIKKRARYRLSVFLAVSFPPPPVRHFLFHLALRYPFNFN
jgi:hypothetical protein